LSAGSPLHNIETEGSRIGGGFLVSSVIATERLVKTYGSVTALKGLTLKVEPGMIFGLLGQNGAGKTTLIKILLGVINATDGDAELLGLPAGSADVRRRVGYLPEDHRFPEYHTGASLLDFYGALLDVPYKTRQERIPKLLELVGIKKRMHSKVRTYSKGMKQRLGIAQSLIHDPELIFFDEPTDGIDPIGRREIRDLMVDLKNQGKTLFINSHLLGELELVCDHVAILHKGELMREGDVKALTRQKGLFVVGLAPDQQFPREEVERLGYDVARVGTFYEVGLQEGKTIDPVVALLSQRGLSLRHLVEKRQTLEDLFIQTVDDAEPVTDRDRARRYRDDPRRDDDRRSRDDDRARSERYKRDDDRGRPGRYTRDDDRGR
jgi:ABC-2 type transport system ATP-binding protein